MADGTTANVASSIEALAGDVGDSHVSNPTKEMPSVDAHADSAVDKTSLQKGSNGKLISSDSLPTEVNGSSKIGPDKHLKTEQINHNSEQLIVKSAEMESTTSAPVSKKAPNGPTKRRSTGVPEHRSRKSSNKKKKEVVTQLDALPGALYLARMKGHQPWPSIICDEDMLPSILIQTRPVTAAQADGTFKKAEFEKGGRREHERSFPVMFLYTNEFAWISNTELTPITPGECADAVGKQKSKTLSGAYNIASEGHGLDHFKQMLLEHQEMLDAEAEAKAERQAKKADKIQKPKRKSDAALSSTEDKPDIDTEKKTKKRKKEASVDDDEKPAKTQKTGPTKLKLNMTLKNPAADPKKKTPKPKQASKRSNARNDGSDEEAPTKPLEEVLSASQLREKKEKEVRYIRHKLQKGFLSRDTVPGNDEIETMSTYLGKVEAHPDLESSILRATKIHKVLKAMIRLESIPKDEEYHFKKRSKELLDKWNKTLASDPNAGAERDEDGKLESAATKTEGNDEQSNVVSAEKQSSVTEKSSEQRNDDNFVESSGQSKTKSINMQKHDIPTEIVKGSNTNVVSHGNETASTAHLDDDVVMPQHEDTDHGSPAAADTQMKT